MRSIMQNSDKCFICGSYHNLELHHIFGGSNRKHSEKNGLKVKLCHNCHNEPPYGVHHNKKEMDRLHKIGQAKFEETHSREEFVKIFGKNYI